MALAQLLYRPVDAVNNYNILWFEREKRLFLHSNKYYTMAKLNWQRVSIQSKQQTYKETLPSNHHYINYDDNQLWSLHGKYHGTHWSKLPVNYLGWIVDNSNSITHTQIAEAELRRRYNELTHKVSGPDDNTAVEKLG